eukprot:3574491-Rhodomonas_salina.1
MLGIKRLSDGTTEPDKQRCSKTLLALYLLCLSLVWMFYNCVVLFLLGGTLLFYLAWALSHSLTCVFHLCSRRSDSKIQPICCHNTWWYVYKKDMEEAASGSGHTVFVAEDKGNGGAKRFASFPSHDAFVSAVLESDRRCFYELIREGQLCKLYFDVEWRTGLADSMDSEGAAAHHSGEASTESRHELSISGILEVIFEVLRAKIPQAFEGNCNPDVIQLVGTRAETKEKSYGGERKTIKQVKNSFHLVFPTIVFAGNKGFMKEIALEVKELVARCFSLSEREENPIDISVYSKGQNFRAPLCYKHSDETKTPLLCDGIAPLAGNFAALEHSQQLEMRRKYLRALVTHVAEDSDNAYSFIEEHILDLPGMSTGRKKQLQHGGPCISVTNRDHAVGAVQLSAVQGFIAQGADVHRRYLDQPCLRRQAARGRTESGALGAAQR